MLWEETHWRHLQFQPQRADCGHQHRPVQSCFSARCFWGRFDHELILLLLLCCFMPVFHGFFGDFLLFELNLRCTDGLRSLNIAFMLPSFLLAFVCLRQASDISVLYSPNTSRISSHTRPFIQLTPVADGVSPLGFSCNLPVLHRTLIPFRSSPPLALLHLN
jgi:hypothetical protein